MTRSKISTRFLPSLSKFVYKWAVFDKFVYIVRSLLWVQISAFSLKSHLAQSNVLRIVFALSKMIGTSRQRKATDRFRFLTCRQANLATFWTKAWRTNNQQPHWGKVTKCCFIILIFGLYRWRPINAPGVTKNVMIATNAEGALMHLHTTSNRLLNRIYDPANQLLTADYK